jgi:hypothetical protein
MQLRSASRDTHVVEQFQQVDIVLFLSKVLLEEEVDCTFKQEGVVDSDVTNSGLPIRDFNQGTTA